MSKAKALWPFVLNALLLVAWCAFIFGMSSANGSTSQGYSDGFIARFLSAVYPGFDALSMAERASIESAFSFPVRKAAHFTEYLILAVLAGNLIRLGLRRRGRGAAAGAAAGAASGDAAGSAAAGVSVSGSASAAPAGSPAALGPKPLAAAWAFCVAFACSDEFHQVFVDGRSAQIFDVCVDAAGALLGLALLFAFCRLPFMK